MKRSSGASVTVNSEPYVGCYWVSKSPGLKVCDSTIRPSRKADLERRLHVTGLGSAVELQGVHELLRKRCWGWLLKGRESRYPGPFQNLDGRVAMQPCAAPAKPSPFRSGEINVSMVPSHVYCVCVCVWVCALHVEVSFLTDPQQADFWPNGLFRKDLEVAFPGQSQDTFD